MYIYHFLSTGIQFFLFFARVENDDAIFVLQIIYQLYLLHFKAMNESLRIKAYHIPADSTKMTVLNLLELTALFNFPKSAFLMCT